MRLLEVHAVGNYSAYNSKYPRQISHYLSNRVAWNIKKRRYKYVPLFLDTHVVETVWYRWNLMGCDDPHSITDNSFIKTCGLSSTCQEAGEGLRRLISKFKQRYCRVQIAWIINTVFNNADLWCTRAPPWHRRGFRILFGHFHGTPAHLSAVANNVLVA